RNGTLVDVLFSEHRDMAAAQAFFRSAQAVTGVTPDRVMTDGHDSYLRAIRTTLGKRVRHRTSRYLNNKAGARPSGHQRPLSIHAGLQVLEISRPVLPSPRRTAQLPPPSLPSSSTCSRRSPQ